MDSNYTSRPEESGEEQLSTDGGAYLVLHNDDVNTFEFVMETLVEVCNHSLTQAEQCAMIAHYKGKCEVLSGETDDLMECRKELVDRGLKATIDS